MKHLRVATILIVTVLVGLVLTPASAQHAGYYVLDAFGGVHAGGGAKTVNPPTPYFGWDAAVDIEYVPSDGDIALGDGILVLDKFGGVHKGGTLVADPPIGATPYFGFDVARAITRLDTTVVYSVAVGPNGQIVPTHPRGVQDTNKLATGKYSVTFDRAVRPCLAIATIGERPTISWSTSFDGYEGQISVYHPVSDHALIVVTRDSDGTLADKPFHVMVHC